jgi:hypothetical protein
MEEIMRMIFDLAKEAARVMDGLWIKNAGNKIKLLNSNKVIYGLYDLPENKNRSPWAIDNPDIMLVEISIDDAGNLDHTKLNQYLLIEDSTWKIINYHFIRNRYLGRYRMGIICSRCEECATNKDGIHIQSSHGCHFEMNDESQNRN